ncbi:MAG: hypothetical protein NUV50_10270 [Rhodospirillales bacterium]|nr:hypothetical protein [Rhodospirillales bacterium]
MKPIKTYAALENLGRVALSESFFMREFLYSEIANFYGLTNVPEDPDMAIAAGRQLCENLLEPLNTAFGRVSIRSGYRSPEVNAYGNQHGLNCAANEANYTHHIWDKLDCNGHIGATACVVLPRFTRLSREGTDWRSLAWWIHDHLPYSHLCFFPKLTAFNIQWHEKPLRRIDSYIAPKGCLTKQGMDNQDADHSAYYTAIL